MLSIRLFELIELLRVVDEKYLYFIEVVIVDVIRILILDPYGMEEFLKPQFNLAFEVQVEDKMEVYLILHLLI